MEDKKIGAYLHVLNHQTIKEPIPVFEGENTVGRNPNKAMVCIKEPQVSEKHAKLYVTDGKIILVDVGSKNGTFLDLQSQEKIAKNEKFTIEEFQKFSFGTVICEIRRGYATQSKADSKNSKDASTQFLEEIYKQQEEKQKFNKKAKQAKEKDRKESQMLEKEEIISKKLQTERTMTLYPKNEKKAQDLEPKDQNDQVKPEKKLSKNQRKEPLLKKQNKKEEEKNGTKKNQVNQSREKLQVNKKTSKEKEKNNEKDDKKKPKKQKSRQQSKEQKQQKEQKNKVLNQKLKKSKDRERGKDLSESLIDKSKEQEETAQPKVDISNQTKPKRPRKSKNKKKAPQIQNEQTTEKNEGKKIVYNTRLKNTSVTRFLLSNCIYCFSINRHLKEVINFQEEFDVLLMDRYTRTFKLLYSIAKGKPILNKDWLRQCEFCKTSVPYDKYWLAHPEREDILFDAVQKVQSGQRVFKGLKFFIASEEESLHLKSSQLKILIEQCGGTLLESAPKTKGKDDKELFVLLEDNYSAEEAQEAKAVSKGNVYSLELVLHSCERQQLDREKHRLDLSKQGTFGAKKKK